MSEDPNLWMHGSQARLISASEAAAILRVEEGAVLDWIAAGLISYVTLPDGESRVRVLNESHQTDLGVTSGIAMFPLGREIDAAKRDTFWLELRGRQREFELRGLEWTEVDVDEFEKQLAERLAAVVPEPNDVQICRRMILVAGAGIDVARMVSDDEHAAEERLLTAGEHILERASEALAEVTATPWPAVPGQFPNGFPPCNAMISAGELHLSYGDPRDPILALEPIVLVDVLRDRAKR